MLKKGKYLYHYYGDDGQIGTSGVCMLPERIVSQSQHDELQDAIVKNTKKLNGDNFIIKSLSYLGREFE